MGYVSLAAAIICEVIATTSLKSSDGFTRLMPSAITVAGYAAAFYFLSVTLRTVPVGVAYAIWSGVGIVLIALAAWLVHGQRIDAAMAMGMVLIVAGIATMFLFSNTMAH